MALSSRRARACAPLVLGFGLFGLAGPAGAAPLAIRPYGNALGDGLGEQGPGLSLPPGAPLNGQVCAAGDTLFGIDVSYYQGDIDWNAVASAGVVFAWIRVAHSTVFEDPKFAANLAGARAAGVHAGVYQYFEPTEDPIAQADLLLELLGPLQPGDLPPMIDVESKDTVPQAAYADAIGAWLDHVEAATGVVPFIYTGYYYWNDNVGSDQFADYPLWIANYNPGCPLVPDAWATWTAHQYCDCGQIAGIDGAVDVDHFNGSMDDLLGHSVGSAVCGDGKCSFGENPYDNCPGDCPPCGVIGPQGGTIDDGEACHELLGDLQYWRHEAVGQGGSLVWTHVTDDPAPANAAVWRMFFAESGTYSLEVWIEQPFGQTKQSAYRVSHADGETIVPVDQSLASGWVNLGEFAFVAGANHFVRIDDNTGESLDLQLQLVADALRITRIDGSDTGSGSGTGGGGTGSGSDGGTGVATLGPGPTSGSGGSGSSSGGGSSGEGGAGLGLPPGYGVHDGCGCRGAPRPAGGWFALVGLMLLRRRRGR
jgi:lysozyme